jgi:hypothetical protein
MLLENHSAAVESDAKSFGCAARPATPAIEGLETNADAECAKPGNQRKCAGAGRRFSSRSAGRAANACRPLAAKDAAGGTRWQAKRRRRPESARPARQAAARGPESRIRHRCEGPLARRRRDAGNHRRDDDGRDRSRRDCGDGRLPNSGSSRYGHATTRPECWRTDRSPRPATS